MAKKQTAKQKKASLRNLKKARSAKKAKAAGKKSGGKKKGRKKAAKTSAPKASKKKSGGKKRGGKKRSSKKRSSKRRRSSNRAVKTVRTKVVRVPKAGTQSVRIDLSSARGGKRRGKRRGKRKNPETALTLAKNPAGAGLMSNAGPFTKEKLTSYVISATAIGLGLIVADITDRFVATMKPADSGALAGNHPWMGRAAAGAVNRRPDAMRLGVQAAGAIGGMALTYFTRNTKYLPWALGGISMGFGVNLLGMLWKFYGAPMVFKIDDPAEDSLGNRLYAYEQTAAQDSIADMFENWSTNIVLAPNQLPTAVIIGPLAISGPAGNPSSAVLGGFEGGQLGRGRGQREFIATGRLGACGGCGGNGGCYSDCPSINGCSDCIKGDARYTVESGDSYVDMVRESGTDATVVAALNGSQDWQSFWRTGNKVRVPNHFARFLTSRAKHRQALAGAPQNQPIVAPPAQRRDDTVIAPPPVPVTENGGGGQASAGGLFQDAE